ncbi:MAG: AzlC family ABC transporter permease [Lachnospiraceae bacterium]|nr:AzlC family ABC transporter permease [Lachnospiraceae bacterium]
MSETTVNDEITANDEMKEKKTGGRTVKKAVIASIPVMTGYLVLGMAFGILLADKGYSFWWAFLMSLTIYAGSMQFVAVNLLSGGASFLSAALMTLLVNARHVVYGISMLEKYQGTGKKKPYLIFALTDETYALLNGEVPRDVEEKKYYFYVSLFDQIYWITGSVIGALIGSALTINTAGIDFAMTALFLVIFTEQWLTVKNHVPALLGLGITLLCLVIFGADNFLIPSMVLIVIVLCVIETIASR